MEAAVGLERCEGVAQITRRIEEDFARVGVWTEEKVGCGLGEVGGEDGTPTVGADEDDDGKDEAADTASGDTDGKPTFGTDDDDDGDDKSADTVSAASGDADVRGDLLSSKDRRRRYWLDYECRTLRRQRMTNPWTLPRTGID